MIKTIAPFIYSEPSEQQSLLRRTLGIYRYSEPSLIQSLELLGVAPMLEFVGGTSLQYQNTRSISAVVRVYDSLTGNDYPDLADVFEYSLVEQGQPDSWVNNGNSGNIQVLNPMPSVLAGHLEATFTLKVRVTRDGSFVLPGVITRTIVVDEVVPVLQATPIGGSYPSGQTIELQADDYTACVIYYTTDGTDPDPYSSYSYVYTAPLAMLDAEIRAIAVDAAGNQSDILSNTYTVDNVAPLIVATPDDTTLGLGEVCNVNWHVNEFCAQVIFELGGDGVNIGTGTQLFSYNSVPANDPRVTTISSISLPTGYSVINIYAVDLANNTGHTFFDIFYSSQVPIITVHETFRPALAIDEVGKIVWSANYGGNYEVRLGGANVGEGTLIASGSVNDLQIIETAIDPTIFTPNSSNTVKIYVTTMASNTGSTSVLMTVDTLPPTTAISHYGSASPYNAPFILTISASDSVVGGISTELGDNDAVALPYSVPMFAPQGGTEWASGGFEYSEASTLQGLWVNQYPLVIGGYAYSEPSLIQPLNVFIPIVISDVAVVVSATTATVTWTTSRTANSTVYYGELPDLSDAVMLTDASLVTDNGIGIVGLQENTTYYYKVTSSNDGVTEESAISSFVTTTEEDIIPPTIINAFAEAISSTEILVTWTTDEPATSFVVYGQASDLSDGVQTAVYNPGGVLNHSVTVSGLDSNTLYYVRAYSRDTSSNANEAMSSIMAVTTWDASAPVVSNVVVSVYKTTVVVRWETDEPALGSIEYGTTSSYGLVAQPLYGNQLRTSHEVLLESLTPDRLYHFNIVCEDGTGNPVVPVNRTFTTYPNRDTRVAIYATTDGSVPTTSHFGFRSIGVPLNININLDTIVRYFASDGFGNHSVLESQTYSFDISAPVITFDSMTPILLKGNENSVVRFKVSEIADWVILNQEMTVLASGVSAIDEWIDALVYSNDMVEGLNHITIQATDTYNYTTSLQVGHIVKDTVPAEVVAVPAAGYYSEDVYVDLIPQNLRPGEQVVIYYTTDGSMPDLYSSAAIGEVNDIQISNTGTIRWFSVDEAGNVEPAKYAHYVIDRVAPTVSANPLPGTYDEVIFVTLTPSEPGIIYYTVNGSEPTESSDVYTAPIQVLRDTTIRCFAKDLAGNISDEIYTFEYRIEVLHDKRFKKVIGFQDKMLLETEVNELQDNLNRRIEELTRDVVGRACAAYGFELTLSEHTFEYFMGRGRAYIGGKFVTIVRGDQDFIPKPKAGELDKNYHIVIRPEEPIFRPMRPGQPGWETGVPEITSYRLEESYVMELVEELPSDDVPHMVLYDVFRPMTALRAADCTIVSRVHSFESLCAFQSRINQALSEMQANFLALGLEVESYKVRNLLGLKNAFVDTFESVVDVDMSRSNGYRYVNTRFEL